MTALFLSSCGIESKNKQDMIFEQCLKYNSIDFCSKKASNKPPIAKISGKTKLLKYSRLKLYSSNSYDSDGYIKSCEWSKNNILISYDCTLKTNAYTSNAGSYYIKLKITDNSGLTSTTRIKITIINKNEAPTIIVKGKTIIEEGSSTIISISSSYDSDGYIKSYGWYYCGYPKKISDNAFLVINGLREGTICLLAEITDNKGLTTSKKITITVKD